MNTRRATNLAAGLLLVPPRTLLAQVIDPGRSGARSASWVNEDHFEVWMGARGSLPGPVWQYGIPAGEGPVPAGYGKPPQLPAVRRWISTAAAGRTAAVLRIELPPAGKYARGSPWCTARAGKGARRSA